MDLGIKGQRALITGGTKGIGRAIADTLADEGCHVSICARNEAEVKSAVDALTRKGVNAFGRAFDVGNGEALASWVKESAEALGGIDIAVANVSGVNAPGEAGWRSNFEYDVLGTVRLVTASLPYLEKSKNGNVIIISTTAALEKFIAAGSYNAMKAALLNYSGALSQDLAPKGIRVNAVSPGPIMVAGGAWDQIKNRVKPFYEATLAQIPLGRMGMPEEVATTIAMLVSPRCGFTTGTNVVVDGGITKRIQY
jgi:3-oxoacyl-[acyl-carrier protein] reductase